MKFIGKLLAYTVKLTLFSILMIAVLLKVLSDWFIDWYGGEE